MIEENKENHSARELNSLKDLTSIGHKTIGDQIPTMICGNGHAPVWIGFGCIKVGTKSTREFNLVNPENSSIFLSVEKCPMQRGFSITFDEQGSTSISLEPRGIISGYVHWIPSSNMSVRETIIISMNSKTKLQLTIHGISGIGEQLGPSKRGKQKAKSSATTKKLANQGSSTLSSTLKAASGPNASRDKSNVKPKATLPKKTDAPSDDKWAEKQVSSICEWMNFKFSEQSRDMEILDSSPQTSGFGAMERKRLACKYRSDLESILERVDVAKAILNIEDEIRNERLCIRSDVNIRANVGLREDLTTLLLSYDLQWLRLGLEVVLGVPICPLMPTSNSTNGNPNTFVTSQRINELWRGGIKRVLNSHLFNCEELRAMHVIDGEVPTPAMEKKYHSDVCKHILRTFLVLVLLLDQARLSGMCNGRTALFVVGKERAQVLRSSKDMLTTFCKMFLRGEGNIIRHLSSLSYNVYFIQSYFDEFNFTVLDVNSDLRDGVRLCHLINILVQGSINADQDKSTHVALIDSSILRIPAISRLQKLHNVGLAMNYLKTMLQMEIPVEEKSIVDGCKNSTMLLLWTILFEFDLKFVTNIEAVRAETNRVLRVDNDTSSTPSASENFYNEICDALQQWFASVVSTYGVSYLADECSLTSVVTDGSALCLLIHFYHPTLIPEDVVHRATHMASDVESVGDSFRGSDQCRQKTFERKNFQVVHAACEYLGGIASVIPTADTVHTLDERTLIIFLGFLFARLIDTSAKWKAASLIQKVFRNSPRKASPEKLTRERASHAKYAFPSVKNTLFVYSKHDAALVITSFMRRARLHRLSVRSRQLLRESVNCVSYDCIVSEDGEPDALIDRDDSCLMQEAVELESESEAITFVPEVSSMEPEEVVIFDEDGECTPEASMVTGTSVPEDFKIELPSLVKFAAHAAVMAQISTQSTLIRQVTAETNGRLAAEKIIAEMREAHERAIREAEALKSELETKLAFEINEKARICEEYERRVEEERLRAEEARRLQEELKRKTIAAACSIQRFCQTKIAIRAQQRRKISFRHSIVAVQAKLRGRLLRQRMSMLCQLVVSVQKTFRRMRQERAVAKEKATASTLITRFLKVSTARLKALRLCRYAVAVQTFWRTYAAKTMFYRKKMACVRIQAVIRRFLSIRSFSRAVKGVLCIQRNMRAFCNIKMSKRLRSAVCIQNLWKKYLTNRHCTSQLRRENLLNAFIMRRATSKINAFLVVCLSKIRDAQSARKLSRWFLHWRPLLRARKLVRGFIRLQALRRSIVVRRQQSAAIKNSFRKLQAAHMRSLANPDMRLGRQTTAALATLQSGKMISHVLKACQTLENCTAYSQVCCKNFVVSAASKILFSLIRSCNRSTPHQELLRCALVVLLNVTKDPALASELSHNGDTTELLVDLMQMFRDKKLIFNLACDLLTRLISAQECIKMECLGDEMKKRLDGILHILERKHRLDQKVKTINSAKSTKLSPSSNQKHLASPFELMCALMTVLHQ